MLWVISVGVVVTSSTGASVGGSVSTIAGGLAVGSGGATGWVGVPVGRLQAA